MTDDTVTCADCGADIHWLDVFPKQRCLACHDRATAHIDPRDLLGVIVDTFNGKGLAQ